MWSDCDDCGAWDWIPITIAQALNDLPDDPRVTAMLSGGVMTPYACRPCGTIGLVITHTDVSGSFVGKYPGGYAAAGRRRARRRAYR